MDTLFADSDNSYFYNPPPLLLLEKKFLTPSNILASELLADLS